MTTASRGGTLKKAWMYGQVALPGLLGIGTLVALKWSVLDRFAPAELTAFFEKFGFWAPVVFVAALTVRPVAFLPGQLLCAVGGLVFGTALGSVYALIGSVLSTSLLFFAARSFGTRPMRRFLGARYDRISQLARHHDFQFAAVCTLNPLLPTDVVVLGVGASGARYWQTILGVLVGTLPGTIITAHFGSSLRQGDHVMTIAAGGALLVSLILGALFGRRIVRELRAAPAAPAAPETTPAPAPSLRVRVGHRAIAPRAS